MEEKDKEIAKFRDNTIRLGYDFFKTKALLTAVRLDIFNTIGNHKKGLKEITKTLKTDERSTGILLDSLVGLGLLQKIDGLYSNTEHGNEVLIRGKDGYIGDILNLQNDMWDKWNRLEDTIKTGKPATELDIFQEYKKETKEFILAMHNTAVANARVLSKRINLRGCKTLIDIGGGSGTYSIYFCRANPGLKATVLDLPGTLKVTRKIVSDSGMKERIALIEGDYNKGIYGQYDAAFVSNIIHCIGEDQNRSLIMNIYNILNYKGKIIIQDFFLNNDKTSPSFASLFSLNMLLYTEHGRTYSSDEAASWLEAAGFRKIKRANIRMPRGISIMTAER